MGLAMGTLCFAHPTHYLFDPSNSFKTISFIGVIGMMPFATSRRYFLRGMGAIAATLPFASLWQKTATAAPKTTSPEELPGFLAFIAGGATCKLKTLRA